jgi:hypothetical protein
VQASADDTALEQLDESTESIANQIRLLDGIVKNARSVKKTGEKIAGAGEKLRETLERDVAMLQDNARALRRGGKA